MSRLLLLRHARAAWAEPGTRDFDRPLDDGGVQDAAAIGAAMCASGLVPDTVLCSTARRARDTWQEVSRMVAKRYDSASFTDALYSSDAAGYLDAVRAESSTASQSILVVGHNPMMEDLAFALAAEGEADARNTLSGGFPAAGLAVIRFDGPLSAAAPSRGFLETFYTPAEL